MNVLVRLCGVVVVAFVMGAMVFSASVRLLVWLAAEPSIGAVIAPPAAAGIVAGVVGTLLALAKK